MDPGRDAARRGRRGSGRGSSSNGATRETEPPARRLRDRILPDGVLFLATAIWGASFIVVREGLVETSPLVFIALRFTLAGIVLAPFVLLRYGPPDRGAVKGGAIVGGWLFLGFSLQTLGLLHAGPARAAFLTGLCVTLVPILSVVAFRRFPSRASLTGVVLATAGLLLLTGAGRGGFTGSDLLLLGCAASFAFQILAVDRHARSAGPARLLLVEISIVAVLAWAAALVFESWRLPWSASGWSAVLFTALLATLAALWAQNWAQQRVPPTRTAVVLTLEPVLAAIFSYLVTGERLGATQLVGSGLILSGMLAAELLPRRPLAGPPARPGL